MKLSAGSILHHDPSPPRSGLRSMNASLSFVIVLCLPPLLSLTSEASAQAFDTAAALSAAVPASPSGGEVLHAVPTLGLTGLLLLIGGLVGSALGLMRSHFRSLR